jgi:hypothetical protein
VVSSCRLRSSSQIETPAAVRSSRGLVMMHHLLLIGADECEELGSGGVSLRSWPWSSEVTPKLSTFSSCHCEVAL